MILSNFILFLVYQKNQCINFLLQQKNHIEYNVILKNHSMNQNQILIAKRSQSVQETLESSTSSRSYDKLVSRNIWQKIINRYLQETVFLSFSNNLTIDYINKLKNMGLSVYDSSQNRLFLNSFSRYLISGKINISDKYHNDFLVYSIESKDNVHIKYTWLKFFNFGNINFLKLTNNIGKKLNQYLTSFSSNSLPLFVLVNNNYEIIMSESVDELPTFSSGFDFHTMITSRLLQNSNNKRNHTCLLFANYNDALEYKNYINYKNYKSTSLLDIKIIPSNINIYNKLKQFYTHKVDVRLIPDLEEISSLLNEYSKYENISFNDNQKYGQNFFQGQPLYQIKPFNVKSNDQKVLNSRNIYFLKNSKRYTILNTCFLNYYTALNAWQQLIKENSQLQLPSNPQILVSNLESFIQDKQDTIFFKNVTFLPSLENYLFIKKSVQFSIQGQYKLQYWLSNQSIYIKTLFYRIFWSLTSRQPNNW
uniref:Uncharacterized protein n=1 Tax=Leptosiphonia brodiei TaxID=2608611 RepID=A0A1Z1M9T0_9FLOR|nr:hypothetical protein [Leptosiphonia brodiei]ARW62868.1 hypothetical protein [Leptosiphonia brodiei]